MSDDIVDDAEACVVSHREMLTPAALPSGERYIVIAAHWRLAQFAPASEYVSRAAVDALDRQSNSK